MHVETPLDHRTPEKKTPSIVHALKDVARHALIVSMGFIGGDTLQPAVDLQRTHDAVAIDRGETSGIPIDALDGRSLIGPNIYAEGIDHRTMQIHIQRTDDGLNLSVDNKTYGIRDHPLFPTIQFGSIIDDVTLQSSMIHLLSNEYGEAHVHMDEARRVMSILASSHQATIRVRVAAQYRPTSGSLIGAAFALKNMWSTTEEYDVTFERTDTDPTMMAALSQ